MSPQKSFAEALKPPTAILESPSGNPPQSNTQNAFNLSELATTLNDIARELNVQKFNQLIRKYKHFLQKLNESTFQQDKMFIFVTEFGQQSPQTP